MANHALNKQHNITIIKQNLQIATLIYYKFLY